MGWDGMDGMGWMGWDGHSSLSCTMTLRYPPPLSTPLIPLDFKICNGSGQRDLARTWTAGFGQPGLGQPGLGIFKLME